MLKILFVVILQKIRWVKLVSAMRNNTGIWNDYYNNPDVCTTETPGWD